MCVVWFSVLGRGTGVEKGFIGDSAFREGFRV